MTSYAKDNHLHSGSRSDDSFYANSHGHSATKKVLREPIAIIGIGCRFPGGANTPAAFWQLLCDGVDVIREVPLDRWNVEAYYDSDRSKASKINTRWGGFIEKIDHFDANFFGISPRVSYGPVDPL